MKLIHFLAGASLALGLGAAATANASLVYFTGFPSTSWADGTFSYDLSGDYPDGFFTSETLGTVGAYNGYAEDGESIFFNSPVTLNSLDLGVCTYCEAAPSSYTVSLYDGASNLLASQTITPTVIPQLLTFNQSGTSTVTFTFVGGADYYGDGRTNSAWYEVSYVTYNGVSVPEPTTWALMVIGFGGLGAALRSRRKPAPVAA